MPNGPSKGGCTMGTPCSGEPVVEGGGVIAGEPHAHPHAQLSRRVEVGARQRRAHREGDALTGEDRGVGIRRGKAPHPELVGVEGGGARHVAHLEGDEVGAGSDRSGVHVNILTLHTIMCQDTDMDSSPPTPAEALGLLVKETQALLHQRMDEELRPLGLSVPQYACLVALAGEPGITASDLARRAFVSRQSMNVLLQGLEARGLIERAADAGPRRERAAQVTAEASALTARAREAVAAVATRMTAGLEPRDQERLRGLLQTARDALYAETAR